MELKEFGKYDKYKAFQQALHQAKQRSCERILAAEQCNVNFTIRVE
jgi:hypothetical protein